MTAGEIKSLGAPLLIAGYCLFSFLETRYHYSGFGKSRWQHARRNLLVSVVNLLSLGALASGLWQASLWAEAHRIGLFWSWPIPDTPLVSVGIFFGYDLLNYGIHRSLHRFEFLWKTHRVHHSDHYLDATSSFFFNPIESVYRALLQLIFILSVGVNIRILAIYQVWSIFALLFAHANLRLPKWFGVAFGWFLVLPTNHRVHHSDRREEHDGNYGIGFMIWDLIFRTFTPPDAENQKRIGLKIYPRELTVLETLCDPWTKREV